MNRLSRTGGTTLIEALVATAVVATAIAMLAGLGSVALRTVMLGRDRTLSAVYAQARLESLKASRASMPASPSDTLTHDTPGWSEFLDLDGRRAGYDAGYAGAVFVRRWQVLPVPGRPGLMAIVVEVGRCERVSGAGSSCGRVVQTVRVAGLRSEAAW
jgi:hypothetical protein